MIDCQQGDLAACSEFWSQALGLPVRDPDEGGEGRYALLGAAAGGWHVEVQRVEHASRLHLDIEADDVDAEADALEAIGARRLVNPHGRWWVMEAPGGHRFCVVRKRAAELPSPPSETMGARHASTLIALVIDCRTDDLAADVAFWSAALGRPVRSADQDGDGRYAELDSDDDEPFLLLQKVAHEPRVHLDIETDDLDAEVERLESIGGARVSFVKRWWVMQAPSGHRFCVVGKQREKPGIRRNTWA